MQEGGGQVGEREVQIKKMTNEYKDPLLLIAGHITLQTIVHFTVVCLVTKPLNRSEAKGDLVMIQTLLLFKCKLLYYHANWILVSITTRSPSASPQIKGLATKCTTVKWPIKLTGV